MGRASLAMAHQTLRSTFVLSSPLLCYEDRDPLSFFILSWLSHYLLGSPSIPKTLTGTPRPPGGAGDMRLVVLTLSFAGTRGSHPVL
jgi:hypothetical protein